jgi:hypothetical protein
MYSQNCGPADPTIMQKYIDEIAPRFPGLRCNIVAVGSSKASSVRAVESYFSLLMATYASSVILKEVK